MRNIKKYKGYSLINITGLALGMACFLLIVFFIQFENSYDNFHENKKNIYQVIRINESGDVTERKGITGAPLAPLLHGTGRDITEWNQHQSQRHR